MCLSLFLQCSRFYLKGKRHQKHLIANEHASLVCLQLKAVQIHLAASLQEQQSALRAMEQQQQEQRQDFDLGLGFGLGALGGESWDATPPDALPGFQKGLEDLSGITGLVPGIDVEPPSAEEGQVSEEAKVPRDDAPPSILPASVLPSPAEGTDNPGFGESGAATIEGNSSLGAPAPASMILGEEEASGPTQVGPPTALGPAGDIFVVINLEAREVEVFAEYHHDFVVAFQVVSVYRGTYGEGLFKVWPRALYRQVVLLGNFVYLQHFLLHVPLTKEYLEAAVQLYLNEVCPEQFPARSQRMRQFLRDGVPNLEVRYQLAKQLGPDFTDISMETASLMYMA
jgi:hypothetical protein